MKTILKALGLSALAAALLYGFLNVAPIVKAGVSCSVPFVFSNGTTADATQVNANFTSLVNCFSTTAAAGANSDITSLSALTTPLSPGQGGTQFFWGGTSGGTANAQTVTVVTPSSGFALNPGTRVCFIPGATNTGITTLNVQGTGNVTLRRLIGTGGGLNVGGNLVGGELFSGSNVVCAMYSGVIWFIDNKGVDYPGEIKDFGFAGCPNGWAEANAQLVNATNFPDINGALGTTWGSSGGSTVMPDLRGRATFGRDTLGTRLTADQNGALAGNTVGTMGGVQNQTLIGAQLPITNLNPSFTAGSFTPTASNIYCNGGCSVNLSDPHVVSWNGGGTFNGVSETASGTIIVPGSVGGGNFTQGQLTTSVPAYTPTITAISAANMNNFTISTSFGSGNSHPVTPPLGIVTKCVKL